MNDAGYLMEDARESARLAAKVDPRNWVDQYVAPVLTGTVPTPGGRRRLVVDVGCGPATLLDAIVRTYRDVEGIGIDISRGRLTDAPDQDRLHRVAAGAGRLPLASARCDLVYCRLLLEYLPRPKDAVAEMVRVCRPGGTVLLQDLDGQLNTHHPPDPELQSDLSDVLAALAATGFDPNVGRTLFCLARAAGLVDVTVRVEGYHVIAGSIDERQRAQWALQLDIARPAIVAAIGNRRAAAAIARYLNYLDRPDTLTFSTQFTVHGKRPTTGVG